VLSFHHHPDREKLLRVHPSKVTERFVKLLDTTLLVLCAIKNKFGDTLEKWQTGPPPFKYLLFIDEPLILIQKCLQSLLHLRTPNIGKLRLPEQVRSLGIGYRRNIFLDRKLRESWNDSITIPRSLLRWYYELDHENQYKHCQRAI